MNDTPDVPAEPEPADHDTPAEDADAAEAEEEAPLNRAARRARDKQAAPSHVGPRQGVGRSAGRRGRPHTKGPR